MNREARLLSLFGVVAVIVVFGIVFGSVPIASAITNGQPDGNRHPFVGVVEFDFGGLDTLRCSGTLVSPTVVVTAAHCVYFFGSATAVRVSFDSEVKDNSIWIQATDFYTDPQFCLGCAPGFSRIDTHDVAVVILSQSVTDKGFASLPTLGLIGSLPNHTPITFVGYGLAGPAKGRSPNSYQVNSLRNYATALLIQNEGVLTDEFVKFTASQGHGNGGVCFGDSGGPAFLGDTNTILATTTLVSGNNCTGVAWSYRLDTESAQNFIKRFL